MISHVGVILWGAAGFIFAAGAKLLWEAVSYVVFKA